MAKAKIVFILLALSLSFAASLKWLFVSYLALPPDAEIPLRDAGILLLLMAPFIAVIVYLGGLIATRRLGETLFPTWSLAYKEHAHRMYKILSWPLKNFFWEPPPSPFKDISAEKIKARMLSEPPKNVSATDRTEDTSGS